MLMRQIAILILRGFSGLIYSFTSISSQISDICFINDGGQIQ